MTTEYIPREEFDLQREHISERLDKVDKSLMAMWKKLDGRPSWSVLIIISTLSSLCVGLITKLIGG